MPASAVPIEEAAQSSGHTNLKITANNASQHEQYGTSAAALQQLCSHLHVLREILMGSARGVDTR